MNSFGIDKGVTIRPSSTANLMLDSRDRNDTVYPSPFQFQIFKNQNTQVGSFTRIGVSEVVLDWNEGNMNVDDDEIILDISGSSVRSNQTISFNGFFNVAQVLDAIADLSGTNGVGLSVAYDAGFWGIDAVNGQIRVVTTVLANQLGIQILPILQPRVKVVGPTDLRRFKYIDIVSSSLTYAQDVKDTSTSPDAKDVLCRWYFSEDVPENQDKYGFPILMGYQNFSRRRIFNPPKQIKWDSNLPLGNLQFEVCDEDGNVLSEYSEFTEWNMTLQLSEN